MFFVFYDNCVESQKKQLKESSKIEQKFTKLVKRTDKQLGKI